MNLGIGIDTGGTYTDAVLFDLDNKKIIETAKSPTTKNDLSVGIGNVLDAFRIEQLKKVTLISLSTTLATNACVENKGGRGKLLFIGVDEDIVNLAGNKYGLKNDGEIYFCKNNSSFDGKEVGTPDFKSLIKETKEWLADADGLAIVELNAMNTGAVLERKARDAFSKAYDFPIICGHELSSKLNSLQRGATAILNVRLMVIIEDFIKSMKSALKVKKMHPSMVVVRSDASLMAETFSKKKPVDTILSGPAASVLGGVALTNEENSIIVDIGGTTTDISLVHDGQPKHTDKGINIGGWRTHVDGIFVDTFGLGGDSAIRIVEGKIRIESRRVLPISFALLKWPSLLDDLKRLQKKENTSDYPIHEFFCLLKSIDNEQKYTSQQLKLYHALKKKPLIFNDAARAVDCNVYLLNTETLEKEGIVMRIGLTPTDIMHLKGDFNKYNAKGAKYLAQYLRKCIRDDDSYTLDDFCEDVYFEVKQKLYMNIVRILLQSSNKDWLESDLDGQLTELIKKSWVNANAGQDENLINTPFKTDYTLIGIGAPTHVFLPDVAKALHTKYIIPKHAPVANALGAISSNVFTHYIVKVKPNYSASGIDNYMLQGIESKMEFDELELAIDEAKKQAFELAKSEAIKRGAVGDIIVNVAVKKNIFNSGKGTNLDLGTDVIAKATGSIGYDNKMENI